MNNDSLSPLCDGMLPTLWKVTTLFLPSMVVTDVTLTIQTQVFESQRVITSRARGSRFLGFYQTQSTHSAIQPVV